MAIQGYLGAFLGVVQQRAIQIICGGRLPLLSRRIGFGFLAAEERTQFPAGGAIVDLHRGLVLELDFEPALVRALYFHLEGQLHVVLAARIHLARESKRLDLLPGLQSAACFDVPFDHLLCAEFTNRLGDGRLLRFLVFFAVGFLRFFVFLQVISLLRRVFLSRLFHDCLLGFIGLLCRGLLGIFGFLRCCFFSLVRRVGLARIQHFFSTLNFGWFQNFCCIGFSGVRWRIRGSGRE